MFNFFKIYRQQIQTSTNQCAFNMNIKGIQKCLKAWQGQIKIYLSSFYKYKHSATVCVLAFSVQSLNFCTATVQMLITSDTLKCYIAQTRAPKIKVTLKWFTWTRIQKQIIDGTHAHCCNPRCSHHNWKAVIWLNKS